MREFNRACRPSLPRGQQHVLHLRAVLLQEGLDQKAVGHAVKRPVDGGFQVIRLFELSYAFHAPGVFVQGRAAVHQVLATALVDVDHAHGDADVGAVAVFRGEGVGQVKRHLVRLFLRAVVEHHQPGHGQHDLPMAVLVQRLPLDVLFKQVRGVLQHPQGHVGVEGGLLFVQAQLVGDDEGHVVVHAHVPHLANGLDGDVVGVVVMSAVDGVVQAERPFLVRFVAE